MALFKWTGIDFGSHSVKIAQIIPGGKQFKLSNFLIIPREEVEAQGLEPEEIATALYGKFQEQGLSISEGILGVTSREGIIRYTRIPAVPPWRLKIIMEYEIFEMANKAGDITADYFNLDLPYRAPQEDMLALVSLVKNELMQEKIYALEMMKVSVKKVLPSCVSLFNSFKWLGNWEDDEVILLLDIGHDNTDMALTLNGHLLFARSLSLGGRLFTKALQDQMGLSTEKAEEIKISQGSLSKKGTPPKVFQALQEGADHFASVINSSLGFCRAQIRQPKMKVHKILISGGGGKLKGMTGFLEKHLDIPVERFQPLEGMDMTLFKGKTREKVEDFAPQMVSVLGLALSEHQKSVSLNLLPQEYQKKYEFKSRAVYLFGAGVFLGLYILLSLLVAISLRSKGTDRVDKIKEQLARSANLVQELHNVREKNQQNIKTIQALRETSFNLYISIKLLDFFNQHIPEGVYLRDFKYLPQESKEGKLYYQTLCYADNSNLEAPQRIKGVDQKLQKLPFVAKTNVSGGVPSQRNQHELKYTIKIECRVEK